MRAAWTASILAFAVVAACRGRELPKSAASNEASALASDVNALHGDFIAALKRRDWSGPDGFEKCVLEPETTPDSDDRAPDRFEGFLWMFPALRRDTYDSFRSANERPRPVAPLDRGAMKLRVLTRAEAAELKAILHDNDRSDYWGILRNRYGTDLRIGLSAPGFSGDRKQAMIYYEAGFDWLGSWGSYCLLKREGDRWEIADEYCVWQS
ncbi:MAG: hypothetical protein ACYS0K_21940 [Planctomycetota bacterium]|jgi:hypothetical protein